MGELVLWGCRVHLLISGPLDLPASGDNLLLIGFYRYPCLFIMSITDGSDGVSQPVHATGGKVGWGVSVTGRGIGNVGVEWHNRVEGVRPKGKPVDSRNRVRYTVTDLQNMELQVPVESNRPVRNLVMLIRGRTGCPGNANSSLA